ncbi:RNA polymerase sigma factor SigJ [Streptomyces albiaxialis]|uniref:RNA polymerase sigma factor SigJ n=1 Tax=Streptomyces albiaxialis TaxID=329523 RepID=A0ABN2WV92_9ACTN
MRDHATEELHDMTTTPHEPGLGAIMSERRQLTNVAYRLLGSLADAEDVVQETYARWYAMSARQRAAIDSPGAWLTRVASRICLDQLRSARARRERYVGAWLPEPLPGSTEWLTGPTGEGSADPADRVTLDESVGMAFLVVLDSMTPAERVAFVLHDVFRFSFTEVAGIVGRTPAACRQLASSARRRVRSSRDTAAPDGAEGESRTATAPGHAEVVREFKKAWEERDIEALVGLLDPAATAVADSGGLVTAVLEPIVGGEQVARGCLDIAGKVPGLTLVERTVNGQAGLVIELDGVIMAVIAFDVADGRVHRLWAMRNPEKLRPWTHPSGS